MAPKFYDSLMSDVTFAKLLAIRLQSGPVPAAVVQSTITIFISTTAWDSVC